MAAVAVACGAELDEEQAAMVHAVRPQMLVAFNPMRDRAGEGVCVAAGPTTASAPATVVVAADHLAAADPAETTAADAAGRAATDRADAPAAAFDGSGGDIG